MKKEDVDLVDPRAEEALEAAIEIVPRESGGSTQRPRDYLYTAGDRLKAAKVVLEFTKAKPAAKNEVTINCR
jgi:hypothetical protein